MTTCRLLFLALACVIGISIHVASGAEASLSKGHVLTVSGTRFYLDGEPFPYTGISFFNAIYNPKFNESTTTRRAWLGKFRKYGINVLRVWCQWDSKLGFADAGPESTLYHADGRLRTEHLKTLRAIIADADAMEMVVLVTLFSRESTGEGIQFAPEAMDRAVEALTRELRPHRNVAFQIWNEFSERVLEAVKVVRAIDPERLVTNSPGQAGDLGDWKQNHELDYLSPHTSRQNAGRHWEVAPAEVAYLLSLYRKPVVDDEPARNGTPKFGGPTESTSPYDQILQIQRMWELGAYVIYHHDMVQTGYGTPACPPHGVPDPEFNPYHRQVLEFIALRGRYVQTDERLRLR